jgi:hypothetical protein
MKIGWKGPWLYGRSVDGDTYHVGVGRDITPAEQEQ